VDIEWPKIRADVYEKKLKARMEAAKRSFAESDSDSGSEEEEGSECQICNEMVPEVACTECRLFLCGSCHEEGKGKHDKKHKVTDLAEVDVDDLRKAFETLAV